MASPEPEIMHAVDIPEDAAAAEAQDALLARIEGVRRGKGRRSPREVMQQEGAQKREERLTAAKSTGSGSLVPVSSQKPRPGFQKGKSPNPGGISKIDRAIRDYARAHSFEAVDFCVMVMRDNLCRTSDRLAAAAAIIDNARLPKSVDGEGGDDGNSITINVLRIGDQVIKF